VDYQRLLIDHLNLIDQIVRTTARRRHLSATEREDFAGFVKLRLVDNDYAVLRKFQGRSSLRTYLAAVIERLALDYYAEKWGRWRPSAMAERLGAIAVHLERLTTRDGHTLDEAIGILRANHEGAPSDQRLRDIWAQLPARVLQTDVGEEAAADLVAVERSDATVADAEHQAHVERLQRALASALAQIAAQDRVLIALRFDQDLPIAEISRLTGKSIPTLHRRLDNSVKQLRASLSQAGFNPRDVAALIGHPSIALSPLLRAEVEKFLGPVRLFKRDG